MPAPLNGDASAYRMNLKKTWRLTRRRENYNVSKIFGSKYVLLNGLQDMSDESIVVSVGGVQKVGRTALGKEHYMWKSYT